MAKRDQPFGRQLFGYRRKDVDEHLAVVDRSLGELNERIAELSVSDDNELVLRATRRAVDDVLQRAHADAERVRSEAEMAAAQLLADAYEIVGARDRQPSPAVAAVAPEPVIDLTDDDGPDPTPDFTESISRVIGE